jgi:hypothetical protein
MQKARSHLRHNPKIMPRLLPLVCTWFQVLFHSPSGVLFTFPSRYYSLSVTNSYLALEDGPPRFNRDFSCPGLLGYSGSTLLAFRIQDSHLLWSAVPGAFRYAFDCRPLSPTTPQGFYPPRFRLFPVRSPLLRESHLISFPRGTEMFQFPRLASLAG